MRKQFAIIIGCIAIALCITSCGWNKFQACGDVCQRSSYCTTCQCTDEGYGRNYCMSLSRYCEAFGNIGAR